LSILINTSRNSRCFSRSHSIARCISCISRKKKSLVDWWKPWCTWHVCIGESVR